MASTVVRVIDDSSLHMPEINRRRLGTQKCLASVVLHGKVYSL